MEYKHFSHNHSLKFHRMPQGTEIQCSGCKCPGSGSVYVCWHCSYFLHEQCFQATRSLKHSSHPHHPLTLLPYPTYPSNSFYCNSCSIIGTGFCYSCSECQFDLHLHCASRTNNTIFPHESFSHSNFSSYSSDFPLGVGSQNFTHNFPRSQTPSYDSVQHNASTTFPAINNATMPNYSASPTNVIMGTQASSPPPPPPAQPVHAPNNNNSPPKAEEPSSPLSPPSQPPVVISLLSNPSKTKEIKHFSHPHNLHQQEISTNSGKVCSGCEDDLSGSGYICLEPQCNFSLHKECFELPREIRHKSHLEHPLNLLAKPPSNYTDNQFTCNACLCNGAAFVYNCSICSFDLHVECVSLPESIIRPDHMHPLKLFYSNPLPKPEDQQQQQVTFVCDVCQKSVDELAWIYYCHDCDFGTHLLCAAYEANPPPEKSEAELIREAELKLAVLGLLLNGGLDAGGHDVKN